MNNLNEDQAALFAALKAEESKLRGEIEALNDGIHNLITDRADLSERALSIDRKIEAFYNLYEAPAMPDFDRREHDAHQAYLCSIMHFAKYNRSNGNGPRRDV